MIPDFPRDATSTSEAAPAAVGTRYASRQKTGLKRSLQPVVERGVIDLGIVPSVERNRGKHDDLVQLHVRELLPQALPVDPAPDRRLPLTFTRPFSIMSSDIAEAAPRRIPAIE